MAPAISHGHEVIHKVKPWHSRITIYAITIALIGDNAVQIDGATMDKCTFCVRVVGTGVGSVKAAGQSPLGGARQFLVGSVGT